MGNKVSIKSTDRIVVDLKMNQIGLNKEKKEGVRVRFAEKYGVPLSNVSVNFIPVTVSDNGERISLASDIIDNVHRPEFQVELERQWLENAKYADVDFNEIKRVDSEVNSFIDFDAYSKYRQYKFKYVKWDNFLSYGKDNFFDFTKLHGLVLLNGIPENQCGKTTFAIDLLRFALFGKCDKAPVLDRAFNAYLPKETEVMVEACIEIDGNDYVIRRTLERPALGKRTAKSKIKQTVEYFKLVNGQYETMENCEGESNTATNTIIRDAVGSVDDFDLVISATSKTLSNLLEMGQADKGRLFAKWLGLLTIEEKCEQAKKMWNGSISKNLLSNIYNRETVGKEISDMGACIAYNNGEIVKKMGAVDECRKNIERLEKERDDTSRLRKHIGDEINGIDVTTVENGIVQIKGEIAQKNAVLDQLKSEIESLSGVTFSQDDYEALKLESEGIRSAITGIEARNGELRGIIKGIRDDNRRIETLMQNSKCPTCGHSIDVSEQTSFIRRNNENESLLISEGVANKEAIERKKIEIDTISKKIVKMDSDKEAINERQKKILRSEAIMSSVESLALSVEKLERQKSEIEKNSDNIRFNNEIDRALENIAVSITNENGIMGKLNSEIMTLSSEIRVYENEISKRNGILDKLSEEEKLIRHWNVYLEMVGKNGIAKIVLRNALPILNNEMARLLDGICDFEALIEMDDKNNVVINLYRDGVVMDLGTCSSGFEGTVTSLALRSALGNISTVSKPNSLTTDEVLSGVAAANYDKVRELYRRIATNYDFIINITHNELISDWHDQNITVVKEGNVSKIEFSEK